jgi:hypothetical protein
MNISNKILGLLLCIAVGNTACQPGKANKHNGTKDLLSFKSVEGIAYTEVSRRSADDLVFNEYGYQLEPEWQINFVSNDSARIYSPTKKQFINFPLTRGYDSLFNTARTWFKLRKMHRDSLVFEVIQLAGDSIIRKGSGVLLKFYSNNYIKNVLHSSAAILRAPLKKDTLFMKALIEKADKDYHKAFAARQPVVFKSVSKTVQAKQRGTKADFFNNYDVTDIYMNPEYDISIHKAYANFHYAFTLVVDGKGQMHYGAPLMPHGANYERLSKAVMESYLTYYLKVTPGKTLGIPHASEITVYVDGYKN